MSPLSLAARCSAILIVGMVIPGAQMLAEAGEATPSPQVEIRNSFWSFGMSGVRHALKAGNGNEIIGNALTTSFGLGYLRKKWYSYGTINILLGPYEPIRERQLNVDYDGTGLTYWLGYSAQEMDLRSPEGGYGFVMGFDYSDITGNSFGRNRQEVGDPDSPTNIGLINNYSMRASQLSVVPSIFFCWLEGGRPKGNTPELLRTRVEGYILTVGFGIPFLSNYRARYTVNVREDEAGKGDIIEKTVKDLGKLEGFSLLINFTSLLGV